LFVVPLRWMSEGFLGFDSPRMRRKFYFAKERRSFHPAWVKGCLRDYVGITTGVPQIAADLLQRPSRQSRAKSRHCRPGQ
jgi:hypothetical protein